MEKKKKGNRHPPWKKILLGVIILLCAVGLTLLLIPLVRLLSTTEGQRAVAERMESFGVFVPLAFVFLQILQVVIAVIPGGPMPLLGELLFGKVGALVLCLAGFFLGTVLIYYLVQWIGRPLVDRFVSPEHFQKFDFLLQKRRLEWLILLVFLLPGLPKDVLTYLVSFDSKIKPMHLFFLTTIGRTPATVLTIFMSDSFWEGNYVTALILGAIIVAFAIFGVFVKRFIDRRAQKRKEKKEQENGKSVYDETGMHGKV